SSGWAVRGAASAAGALGATGTRLSSVATGTTGTTTAVATTTNTITLTLANANVAVGMEVVGTGIPAGTTVSSITSTTVFVLSNTVNAPASTTLTFFAFRPIQFASTMYFGLGRSAGFAVPAALNYSVTRTTANDYISIVPTADGGDGTGTAVPGITQTTTNDDVMSSAISLTGTTFQFQGVAVTGLRASTNGWLTFNTAETNSNFNNGFAGTSARSVIAPYWDDLFHQQATGFNSRIYYKIAGTLGSGSAVITVEWFKYTYFGANGPELFFQVVLEENGNKVSINYGNMQTFNGTFNRRHTYSMGLMGSFVSSFPQAGEIMAQQYENTTAFSQFNTLNTGISANALFENPTPRSSFIFTPGTYTAPVPFEPVVSAPVNDNVAGAINVTPLGSFPSNIAWNTTEVPARSNYYTLRAATQSPQAICGGPANAKDVWFKFTCNDPNTQIRVYPSGGMIPAIEVLNSTLTSLVPASCNIGTVEGTTALTTSLVGLTVGNEYFVRVYNAKTGTTASFGALVAGGVVVTPLVTSGGTNYPTLNTAPGPLMRVTGGGGNGATFSV
ncbi:MAG: hypothetical protein ACKOW8_05055, partial [Flavobacteriales bacterium]